MNNHFHSDKIVVLNINISGGQNEKIVEEVLKAAFTSLEVGNSKDHPKPSEVSSTQSDVVESQKSGTQAASEDQKTASSSKFNFCQNIQPNKTAAFPSKFSTPVNYVFHDSGIYIQIQKTLQLIKISVFRQH